MTDDPRAIVRTRGLTKRFGRREAVRDLDLAVPRGVVFGLLGENGAGKSTTIRMLLGLTRPTRGSVELLGRPLARERLGLLGRVGSLIEGPAFYPYLSGARNLRLLGDLAGGVSPGAVAAALDRVGLGDRGGDPYRSYSTGMRQRLGIAAAFLHEPDLIVLDEPMSGLDPPAVVLVRGLIRHLAREEGKTVLVSSHLLHEVELSCDAVAVLRAGRLVTQGRVDELLHPERTRVEVTTSAVEEAYALARAFDGAASAERTASGVTVELAEGRAAELNRHLVEGGVPVAALVPKRRTLEDLFAELNAPPRDDAA